MSHTKPHKSTHGTLILIVLALLSIFPPLATDMYLSAFGEIQQHLHAPHGAMEHSLSVFFLGLCVGQMIFGPLVDRYGRKKPLLWGAGIFCLSTVFLLSAQSTAAFIALRFLQAVGACAGMAIGRAIVADLYHGVAAARTMTLLITLMALGPVLSPLLGSFLVAQFGWRAIFVAMLLIGVVALVLTWLVLPETLASEHRLKAPPSEVFLAYLKLLTVPEFIAPAIVSSLVLGELFSFITASPAIFRGMMSLGRIEYGLVFGAISLGLIVASGLNSRLLDFIEVRTIINFALPASVIVNIVLCLSGTQSLLVLVSLLWLSVSLIGFLSANCTSLAMEASRCQSGGGSALLGALQFGTAFICSSVVAWMISVGTGPLALGMFVPAVFAQLLWLFADRWQQVATDLEDTTIA